MYPYFRLWTLERPMLSLILKLRGCFLARGQILRSISPVSLMGSDTPSRSLPYGLVETLVFESSYPQR